VTKRSIIVEITGTTDKVEAFERMVARSGSSR
jgi:acetolactate synthase small subunit